MLFISSGIGAINALGGYQIASFYDVSIAGSMASFTGITFLIIFVFEPQRGMISVIRKTKFQTMDFATKTLLFHLFQHEGKLHEDAGIYRLTDSGRKYTIESYESII